MQLFSGTSGYSYKEWKGSFYPEKIKDAEMLGYYASQLSCVEINNTFYRMPKKSVLAGWREQVPDEFRFVIKASRRITHIKRLKDAYDEMEFLCGNVETIMENLGCLLFQLPGNLRKDVPRLKGFLDLVPLGLPCAFEFRHDSWVDDEVHDCLREAQCAVCIVDDEDRASPAECIATAPWGYFRLRRPSYQTSQLEEWLARITAQDWEEAYVFFKHEDAGAGPMLARQFADLAAARSPQ